MERLVSLAAPARPVRHPIQLRLGSRSLMRLGMVALLLAFAHVWESVSLAELRTRIDHERNRSDQLKLRLRQLTSQLAQWSARAEAAPGVSSELGFAIPRDGQVVLLSASLVDGGRGRRLASAAPSHPLWDWMAGSAEAESRGTASPSVDDETLP